MILNSDQNPDLNIISKFGPPIHLAITTEQDEIIQYLLDKRVDIKLRDKDGNTVLHHCIKLKLFNLFKLIFDHIVKSDATEEEKKDIISAVNNEGNTILHEFALQKSFTLIDKVKEIDENIRVDENVKNKDGFNYKEAYEDVLNLEKLKVTLELEKKKLIRNEKDKLINQKFQEEEDERKEENDRKLEDERKKKIGLMLIKYRGWIFGVVAIVFMVIVLLIISNATKKKSYVI